MFSNRTGRNAGDHFDLAGADEDGKEPLLAQILQPSKYFPELKQTALYRKVGSLIGDLLGPGAKVTGDHAINKPPRHGGLERQNTARSSDGLSLLCQDCFRDKCAVRFRT
jgi:hypothetical protein